MDIKTVNQTGQEEPKLRKEKSRLSAFIDADLSEDEAIVQLSGMSTVSGVSLSGKSRQTTQLPTGGAIGIDGLVLLDLRSIYWEYWQ
jgi:hypothetical protein